MNIKPFDGKEVYQGLGSGFQAWGRRFIRAVSYAETACGYTWSEEIKVELLGYHLTGIAERYFNTQIQRW
ncbi:TPA: hypothetical protein N0F65_012737 [Lagenidium giganteum]|uniref:Uncharacterized protein n=1 Tax=Lagenidium giganteum TaxID=4803 RepID=A0AAV2YBL5_9STRA|nr:TPA: hypothetical protein N0F65_012737 [Lagenidium giganteum]